MSSFIHRFHQFLVLITKFTLVFTVIFFLPVPLSHFLTGSILSETQYSPLFEYFTHYNISTDDVLESAYTNVYITEQDENAIKSWEIDNAILWADALAYKLQQQNIPVIKKVITQKQANNKKQKKQHQKKKNNQQSTTTTTDIFDQKNIELPQQIKSMIIEINRQFGKLLPFISLTEQARQWIIVAVDSSPRAIKKQLKKLQSLYGDDNFLVITRTPIDMDRKSIKIDLPESSVQQAIRTLVNEMKITQKQAEILVVKYKVSMLAILRENEDNRQFTLKSLLGESYNQYEDLTEKEEEVLQKICEQGKAKVGKAKMDLSDYGVVVRNKYYEWAQEEDEINYQLQRERYCGKGVDIDKQIRQSSPKKQQQAQQKQKTNTLGEEALNQHQQHQQNQANNNDPDNSLKEDDDDDNSAFTKIQNKQQQQQL